MCDVVVRMWEYHRNVPPRSHNKSGLISGWLNETPFVFHHCPPQPADVIRSEQKFKDKQRANSEQERRLTTLCDF